MSKTLPSQISPRQQSISDLDRDTLSARWDLVRREADLVAWMYKGHSNERVRKWGHRIGNCAQLLKYEWIKSVSDSQWRRRLVSARLCRVRTCPVCRWRRSLRLQADTLDVMRHITDTNPTLRCVLLTLTVRNPQLEDLKETLKEITRAWSKLTRRVIFNGVVGWIRSIEVTPGTVHGAAHPHLHALLLVDESFSASKLDRNEWAEEWQSCLGLNYLPVCDVRPITSEGGVLEVLKYTVKPGDGSLDSSWLPEVALALDRVRVFATGGIIKVTEPPDDEEEEDLKGTVCDAPPIITGVKTIKYGCQIVYEWKRGYRRKLVIVLDNHMMQIRKINNDFISSQKYKPDPHPQARWRGSFRGSAVAVGQPDL